MQPVAFFKTCLIIAAGALTILLPALINGYPFVYSDTGTYLHSAFSGYVPYDRPYWYGPFVRATSLDGISLWGVALAQALLCSLFIWRICRAVCSTRIERTFAVACLVLTLGSSLGWYAARLIPDVFTGIGLLAMYLLLRSKGTAWSRILDGAVIVAACWFHTSNLLILPIAGAVLLFIRRREGPSVLRRTAIAFATVNVLAWGGLMLANKTLDGQAYISRNSHVFFMGRMIDTGMLKPYLDEHCPTDQFGICAYRDSLPKNSQAFLWSNESPIAKQGGWQATKEEYSRIVRGSFTEPKYLWWHVRGSVASTVDQLCAWEICHAMESQWYRTETSPPYMAIRDHLPHEFPRFMGAMQNGGRGELSMRWPDLLYGLVMGLSLVLTAWFMFRVEPSPSTDEVRTFLKYSIAAIAIGAWICASLSVVDTRYLSRDSWLLPLAVVMLVMQHRSRCSVQNT